MKTLSVGDNSIHDKYLPKKIIYLVKNIKILYLFKDINIDYCNRISDRNAERITKTYAHVIVVVSSIPFVWLVINSFFLAQKYIHVHVHIHINVRIEVLSNGLCRNFIPTLS